MLKRLPLPSGARVFAAPAVTKPGAAPCTQQVTSRGSGCTASDSFMTCNRHGIKYFYLYWSDMQQATSRGSGCTASALFELRLKGSCLPPGIKWLGVQHGISPRPQLHRVRHLYAPAHKCIAAVGILA